MMLEKIEKIVSVAILCVCLTLVIGSVIFVNVAAVKEFVVWVQEGSALAVVPVALLLLLVNLIVVWCLLSLARIIFGQRDDNCHPGY